MLRPFLSATSALLLWPGLAFAQVSEEPAELEITVGPAPTAPPVTPAVPPAPPTVPPAPPAEPRPIRPASAAPGADAEPHRDAPGASEAGVTPPQAEGEVVVLGSQAPRVPGSFQVLGQRQLERFEYDDSHAVLRQVPGVYIREEDGVGLRPNISMRGANPDRSKKVTLMEDGVLFGPAPYSAPAAYYFPLLTRMTQVRAIKGPAAIAYGPQTIGGALDLITRGVPTSPRLFIDGAYGMYGYRKAHAFAGASTEQFGALIEGVHLGNDGFKTLPQDQSTGFSRNEWMVKGSYILDPTSPVQHEFSLKLGYSDEASNETYLGLSDEDFTLNPNRRYPSSALDRLDNHRTSFALRYQMSDPSRKLTAQATLYRNDLSRVWRKLNRLGGGAIGPILENPSDPESAAYYGVIAGEANTSGPLDTLFVGPNQRSFVSQGLESSLKWSPTSGVLAHEVELGARLHYDSIERDHREEPFAMVGGELYPTGDGELITTQNFADSYVVSVHASDAVRLARLTVTPGIRMEAIYSRLDDHLADERERRALLAVLPGLGAHYAITDSFGVLAGAYRGFSPPPPGSEQDPEYAWNLELGARFMRGPARAELIGFFSDYQNLTDICTFSSGCADDALDQQFDAGRAFITGLEALVSHEPRLGPVSFPVWAAYTLSYGEFGETFDSADPIYGQVEAGDEVPYLPRHQLSLQLALEYDRFEVHGTYSYASRTREQAGNEPIGEVLHTDTTIRVDLGASVRLLERLKLYANLNNAFDRQRIVSHRPFGARPNAPVWFLMGLKLDL